MSKSSENLVSIISAFLMLIPWICFILVISSQFNRLKNSTERLQVLICRSAICLPFYAFFIFITLLAPGAYNGLQVPIAIFEAYSFKCFFNVLVKNLGGPTAAVKTLTDNNKPLFCSCCCPSDKASFYNNTLWALWHIMYTRVALIILATILENHRIPYVLLSLAAFILLVYAVLSVVNFFENVYEQCENLMAVSKFVIIKVSVGLIVIQGLIVEIIVALGKVTLSSDGGYSSDDRAYRVMCFIVLIEYVFISCAMYVSFGNEIQPSTHSGERDKSDAFERPNITLIGFLSKIFMFHDIFVPLTPDAESLTSNPGDSSKA